MLKTILTILTTVLAAVTFLLMINGIASANCERIYPKPKHCYTQKANVPALKKSVPAASKIMTKPRLHRCIRPAHWSKKTRRCLPAY